ncbi:MAG TPA: dual specificity protein phosphatase [Herpetosiphonaceae bacterium]
MRNRLKRLLAKHSWIFVQRSRVWAAARRVRRLAAGKLPPNVDRITDQLFVGGFIDQHDWAALAAMGVTVDINLQAERADRFGAVPPEAYLWLPTADHTAPDMRALHTGVAFARAAITQNQKIFIHCHAGMGRSALLCAAILVSEGRSAAEAWQIVKAGRKVANLNIWQREALEAFSQEWQQKQAAALLGEQR